MSETKSEIVECKLRYQTSKGKRLKAPVKLEFKDGRVIFRKSPFNMKDEIKSMAGAKWHGYDKTPKKYWSVEDNFRNRFQLHFMMGDPVYEWFEKPLVEHEYREYHRKGVLAPPMPHQVDMANHGLSYHFQIWGAEMGVGKGGCKYTRIATPTGWTTFGEIKVGDVVINPDGGTTRVKGVFPRGKMEMFRVTFTDDSSVVCSGDHLWNVRTTTRKFRGQPYETLELNEILDRGLQFENGNNKHYIPMVAPVEYTEQPLEVDPYLMGYLLGNGCMTGSRCAVTIPDKETATRLDTLMETPLRLLRSSSGISYGLNDVQTNQYIKDSGLKGHYSYNKWVPKEYLFNSVENRISLLQGLCDSDGYAMERGGVEFSTTSPGLRDTFVTLAQSLGGTCHVTEKVPTYTYKDEKLEGRLAYIITASFHSSIMPFRLSRKRDDYVVPTKYEPTRAITKVESIGEEECICIAVEADNQLYVTDEYIVTHNTLSAQMVIENSGVKHWYWVGPKTSLPNIKREFLWWGFDETVATIEYMTYERLVRIMDEWTEGDPLPGGVIFDESSRLKTCTSQRSLAAQKLADLMRAKYMWDAYIILMSGTPSPKRPTDWWSQGEIAWPGFLREGSVKALEKRLAFQVQKTFDSGTFWTTVGWRDDEHKCEKCGLTYDEGEHELDVTTLDGDFHKFKPAKNEVAYMFDRLNGLALIKHKIDCLTLPEKRYRKVACKPTSSLLRVAKTIVDSAQNAMVGMTKLRELSDGFQYREVVDGTRPCNHCPEACGEVAEWFDPEDDYKRFEAIDMLDEELVSRLEKRIVVCPKCNGSGEIKKLTRITKTVPCPKEKALRGLLGECEETGRIVIFAGFTGSVDRCTEVCHKEGWAVVRCDGRGFQVTNSDGTTITDVEPLDFWSDMENKSVAFVAHPESGGMSLTLVEARMAVYWSNSFKPEYRVQSEDRIHRKGMDENLGCVIVDLIHLPTDERVVDIIRENRKLELMTMGKIMDGIKWEDGTEATE